MRIHSSLLAIALLTAGLDVSADDFRYERGRITKTTTAVNGQTTITINRGSDDGVYKGSTGLAYDISKVTEKSEDDGSDPFVKDAQGTPVAFSVDSVTARESIATVTKGATAASKLMANPHIVLRATPYGGNCPDLTKVGRFGIDKCVVARIRRWDAEINKAAGTDVDANLVRGIIASETEGKTNEVSATGYKGITQSNKFFYNLEAEKSIDDGADNVRSKQKSLVSGLKKLGVDFGNLSADEKADALLAAYNAGQVTVIKAFEYAKQSGGKWNDFSNYARALLYTGAYSSKAAANECVPKAQVANKDSLVKEADAQRLKYECLKDEDAKKSNDNGCVQADITFDQAKQKGAPDLMLCAVKFKAEHGATYREKIKAYRSYFAANK